jgi:hypothetical protein
LGWRRKEKEEFHYKADNKELHEGEGEEQRGSCSVVSTYDFLANGMGCFLDDSLPFCLGLPFKNLEYQCLYLVSVGKSPPQNVRGTLTLPAYPAPNFK